MRAALLSVLLLAGPAAAQDAAVWSPEAVTNLKGFVRGFSPDCATRCDAAGSRAGAGQDCVNGCTCLVANASHRLDPRTLEAGGKPLPDADDIARFVADNSEAFEAAIEICGMPLPMTSP